MTPWLAALLTGCMYAVAALAIGLRSIAFEPQNVRLPRGPTWVRLTLNGVAVILAFSAAAVLFPLSDGRAVTTTWRELAVSAGIAGYAVAMLVNVLRQRYPESVWRRINRINEIACCRPPRTDLRARPF